ncbi:MAG TPA: hypothetical protein PLP23_11085 [Panacibacter sp.]|nr:hypothetical protein [Panacibacter sp.]
MNTDSEKNIKTTYTPEADKTVVILIADFAEAHFLQLIDGAIS